ncbi:pyruvate:ferredoxin (flavodoxin) oxidoreductase [Acidihalobacter prosperus]
MNTRNLTIDGNKAVAHIAYRINEVCSIYPITPSSPMAEWADTWSTQGIVNIWGNVPEIQEMQAEGGAAGCVHGSLQSGALTTTFTASQGLMLMIPNMYKIAGELSPTVFHVAARSLAAGASSIFGDHQDIMAVRSTGFAILGASSVQEGHDLALIAQACTLSTRIPFIHFMDGFRTSHEYNNVELIPDDKIRALINNEWILEHRARALSPEHPVIRGTWQNPDTYFQTREAVNSYYQKVPDIVEQVMDRFESHCGRRYRLFRYDGASDAEYVIISMGSGAEVVRETALWMSRHGHKAGALQVLLYRPFSRNHFLSALPRSVKKIAVLDRTKEPGAPMEPLQADVVGVLASAVSQGDWPEMPAVIGGRYGLSSKDFNPGMVKAVFEELKSDHAKDEFTVGINDDVSHLNLFYDPDFNIEPEDTVRCLFYGLGADGTVGANKNSVKILSETPGHYAQAYFDYDSHKSGGITVSHLRFGRSPISAPYLVRHAHFVACHKFDFLDKFDILESIVPEGIFLLNSPYDAQTVWQYLPGNVQQQIIDKQLRFYVIDASGVALRIGLGPRVNTILQTCFFYLANVMPFDEAKEAVKNAIQKTYSGKGEAVVKLNFNAVDAAIDSLQQVKKFPANADKKHKMPPVVPKGAPKFVRQVTGEMMARRGNEIPVSLIPADGTFPVGTTQFEKRNIAVEVPVWEPDLCVQCGQCSIVCPHSVIRAKTFNQNTLKNAPDGFKSVPVNARGYPDVHFSLQFYVEDCTGCGVCVENCPVIEPSSNNKRAINMALKLPLLESERKNIDFFESLPEQKRSTINFANVRGIQFLTPLFEFSGACAGCGETPYLKLISQLFGERMQVANATGCSSIYAGNTPAHAWRANSKGQGVAWSNSLFEDAAEFGLGYRLAIDKQSLLARQLLQRLAPQVGNQLATELLEAKQRRESQYAEQRQKIRKLKDKLDKLDSDDARSLQSVADFLLKRSVWIIGGDGWAYDIGYGGLDHVLAQGRDVNVLVLDTEVYSNTGGQSSKATPLGAVAKFATGGKRVPRKDFALQAIAYGNVYVAQIALGANPEQALIALREAEAYPGPSLILAYSQCIAHGIDMRMGMKQQARAVASGYWPLFRFDPELRKKGLNPFRLDSTRPRIPFQEYAYRELRYKSLSRTNPESAVQMLQQAQAAVDERYRIYEDLAARDGSRFLPHWEDIIQ